jgi:hypothetical protein
MQIKSERENDSFVPVGAAHYRSGNQSRDQGFLPPSLPFFALRCSALGTSLDDSLIYGVKKDENVGFSRAVRLLLCSLHKLSFLSTKKKSHHCLSVGTSVYFGYLEPQGGFPIVDNRSGYIVTGLQAMFPNNYAGFMSLMSHRIDRAQMMG